MESKKLLKPKYDVVFQALFQNNKENITESLISDILEEKLNTKWQITETSEGKKILTNKLELHIIEIPKAKRILEKEQNNRIAQWISFIDDPNAERMENVVKKNEEIKKAKSVLCEMSEDEKLERLAFLKERAIMEEQTGLICAKKEGIEEGARKEKIEIAKKMKTKNISIKEIKEITGLTEETIIKL